MGANTIILDVDFRLIVDQAPYGVALANVDGSIAYVNATFSRLFGYTLAELPDLSSWWQRAYPDPAYRDAVMADWAELVAASAAGAEVTRCFEVCCRNGERKDIRFRVSVLPDGRSSTVFEDVTATHRIELALRASEERFRHVFERVPSIAVQGYSPTGVVRYWNPASEQLYGYSRQEAMGANLVDLIIPEAMRQPVLAAVKAMTSSGEGFPTEELELRNKTGEAIPVLSSHVVIQPEGAEAQLYCLDVDLRSRKAVENALAERESELRQILDASSVAIFLVGHDWRISFANLRMAQMFGCSLDDLIGREYVALLPIEERETARRRMSSLATNAVPVLEIDRPYQRDDGSEFWGHISGRRFTSRDGNDLGLLGVIADIDERKRASEALNFSQQQFRDLVDTSPGIVWEADANGFQFTYVSQEAERLLGFPVGDWQQPGFWASRLHPDDRDWAPLFCAACTARLETHDFEYRFIAKDGREVWLRDIVKVVAEDGKARWLRGVMIDVTEQKKAAERHSRVVETSMDGFIALGMAGRVTECNLAICAMTGYSREEFLALSIGDLESGQTTESIALNLQVVKQTGYDRFETAWRRKDGSTFDVEITASHLHLGDEICGFARDITQAKQHERELHHIAHYDALTGVPNRTLLADRMRQSVAQCRRTGTMMAFCYLDLDGFKPVNDQYGHEAGDRVLVEIAQRLRNCLRGGDTVARMGGDEFVLLLLGIEKVEICEAALKRILESVAEPLNVNGAAVTLSASLGVSIFPRDDADVDTLLRHADQAMYLAKQSGRNRYHLFDPDHDRLARDRSEKLTRLRLALARREFVLFYQPQVNMALGRVDGVEALIRWQHPERGLLPPADFLSVIEDSDLIVEVGDWVIATALTQLEEWKAAGVELTVGVNIAARHLLRQDFVASLQAHLQAHPTLDPRRLDIEVLETAALEDIAHVSRVIAECRAIGVSFSLDDFGTGYSSLTYLKALPAKTLKIDQTFVRDMLTDPEDRAIVQGVIGLSRVFHREVIAEGVETIAHGTLLLALGCELAQGYGIARPMPAAAVVDWVGGWQPDAAWGGVGQNHSQKF